MEKDMQSYRLSDIVKIKNGKDHKMLSNGKYPVLGSGGIMRYVDNFLYNKPSVLLPRKGTLDNIQYCDVPFWTVDTLYYTKVNTELANPYYLYRYLSLLDLSNLDSGTGVPSMTFDNYYGLKIFLPSIEKQTMIARVLQTLDKKIAVNRQINQNLEAMARQFYDYWFVQFDFPNEEGKPYKSSGGGMLWNDKLKRNIPVGWHCGNLFEIAVFTNGLACQKFRPKDDEVPLPVIKIREMHDGISVDTEEVTSNIPESVKVYNGDVLFSWSASLEVMLWAYGLGGLNQHIFKVTSANDFPKSFYYFQLLDYVDVFKKMAEARKTTMGHITQDHLQQSTIAIPDNKDIADKFEELISPIFKQIVKLQEEISNLIKQRDELLPLLMNGQITIE
ncbi:restriction endonuclease subunit S [Parabacteroides sp. CH2-D42-20]|uniref:restriction endonuclease subunit S n=3 Tax=Bacteroidales TaxID=171549 RepID=UPI000EF6CDA6|nr:restriction endonuclease subunit S [Parabacteroides sp. CH2-D42-20]RLT70952.1 restriction endonuclease subunit S [Parabacteroides sp. CH2-D42-20]